MSSSKHAKAVKPAILEKHQIHKKDTGSPEVQIAVLSDEIKRLTEHLKINPKDHSSRRGLLRKVGRRKKLLNYLLGEDKSRYLRTCKKNGIRPNMMATTVTASVVASDTDILDDETEASNENFEDSKE